MKAVVEFKLTPTEPIRIEMPVDTEIIACQVRPECAVIWGIVDTENEDTEVRIFITRLTNSMLPEDDFSYIGTFQANEGKLAFHVFEVYDYDEDIFSSDDD